MDEVDHIIIETLRALHCDIPAHIDSLGQFGEDLVVLAISACLEGIIPATTFPKKLPSSMAMRLKFAAHLAEQIKVIGFKDEIGYQTILYFNELELRKLLIFLIEMLPREAESSTEIEVIEYIPKLLIELKYKLSNQCSVSSSCIDFKNASANKKSYGNSFSLKVKKLRIPIPTDNISLKNYFIHVLPTVRKQCPSENFIASLLFEDCKFSVADNHMMKYLKSISFMRNVNITKGKTQLPKNKVESIEREHIKEVTASEQMMPNQNTMHSFTDHLEIEDEYHLLRNMIDKKEAFFCEVNHIKDDERGFLEGARNRLKIRTRTVTILSEEENLQKLKFLVENAKQRLVELAYEWNRVQGPRLEKYKYLENFVSIRESAILEKDRMLKDTILNYEELLNDFKKKVDLENKLVEMQKSGPKSTNRHIYTKNIMEIIGNINKQNNEMQKILLDTKALQRDINSLTGQIERSFTLADELIYSNAKRDESSRKAYKMLVSLHNDCGEIVKIISDIGFLERECRNLQELLDNETTKETSIKFKRLNEDLLAIKEENMHLMKQV